MLEWSGGAWRGKAPQQTIGRLTAGRKAPQQTIGRLTAGRKSHLNLSNRQIARELGLDGSDGQAMTEQLRRGLVAKAVPVRLDGEVEIDEVYVVAGHKGQPAAVAKRGGLDAAAGWRGRRAAARWRRTSRRSSA